ncbi:hypothetical protein PCANC_01363 [Puccinia coronata f. sp. avenae]|uniref:Uncharacterized protein n=1 Tax=Puccinia coronata f. sp. avenae TaxID=200324 RepID=A0A2N5W6A0_9BASI|nr:hypothetical protein PCANC_01363 [Puccinia coronata f. sp. avenae]
MSTRRRIGNTTKIATRGCIVQDDKPAIPANEHKEADWEHYQDCHAWLHCARRQARSYYPAPPPLPIQGGLIIITMCIIQLITILTHPNSAHLKS